MLTSPVGRGGKQQAVYLEAFSIGLVLGGVFTASLVWLLSGLTREAPVSVRVGALATFAIAALARDSGVLGFRLPQSQRQIPRSVFGKGMVPAALQFGFELGTGLRTYLPSTAPYVLVLAFWLLPVDYWAAALAGACFGLGRAVVPLLRQSSAHGDEWDRLMPLRAAWFPPASSALGLAAVLLLAVKL